MQYYKAEFKIECAEEQKQDCRDLLCDLTVEAGFESFEDTDIGINGYVQRDLFHQNILDDVITNFPIENVHINYTISSVLDEDWNQEWESIGFEPIDIDEKLMVFDARKSLPLLDRPISIGIEAKNAFGTGTHETTRMILSQLLNTVVDKKRVLDCGCGTGILSIAASKLGAEEVVAYDIDEWSVENAKHNAEINNVENIEIYQGDANVLNHISGVFDIVLANINRNIILNDISTLKSVMHKGSLLILSGLYMTDVPMILDHAKQLGLEEYGRKNEGEWACLVLTI